MTKEPKSKDLQEEKIKKTRDRSPNFPFISLSKALERAKDMSDKHKRSEIPIRILHEVWKYQPMSAIFQQTIAALSSYGLIDVEGEKDMRRIRISDKGFRILEEHRERQKLLQESALEPKIHKAVWEKYNGDLPNDDILKDDLIWGEKFNFKFNKDSVDLFIENFRETIKFAKLIPSDIIEGHKDEKLDKEKPSSNINQMVDNMLDKNNQLNNKERKIVDFPIPLSLDSAIILKSAFPMTEEDWKRMLDLLELYKAQLVKPKQSS